MNFCAAEWNCQVLGICIPHTQIVWIVSFSIFFFSHSSTLLFKVAVFFALSPLLNIVITNIILLFVCGIFMHTGCSFWVKIEWFVCRFWTNKSFIIGIWPGYFWLQSPSSLDCSLIMIINRKIAFKHPVRMYVSWYERELEYFSSPSFLHVHRNRITRIFCGGLFLTEQILIPHSCSLFFRWFCAVVVRIHGLILKYF